MATKKSVFKKQAPVKPSLSDNLKKKWWAVLLLVIFVFAAGSFAFNKYLDYKNVQDMKTLLADFQQLEKEMEEKTGEDFTIEANCGSVGKFATSYACSILLVKDAGVINVSESNILAGLNTSLGINCEQLFNGRENAKNSIFCVLSVRSSNEKNSEKIFYEYDKSPNSPY